MTKKEEISSKLKVKNDNSIFQRIRLMIGRVSIQDYINSQKFGRDKFSDFFLSEYLSAEILPNPKFFPTEIFGF